MEIGTSVLGPNGNMRCNFVQKCICSDVYIKLYVAKAVLFHKTEIKMQNET